MTRGITTDLRSALRTALIAALICVALQIAEVAYYNTSGYFTTLLGTDHDSWAQRLADGASACYFVFMVISDPLIIFSIGNPPPSFETALWLLTGRSPFIVVQYFFAGFFWWYARHRSPWYVIPTIMSYFGAILTMLVMQALHIR